MFELNIEFTHLFKNLHIRLKNTVDFYIFVKKILGNIFIFGTVVGICKEVVMRVWSFAALLHVLDTTFGGISNTFTT